MNNDHADPRLAECLARWDGQLSNNASRYCSDLESYIINRVQAYVSKFQYRRESHDYWKTPTEFLSQREGDCEDFAICAGAMLREILPHLDMWLVLCRERDCSRRYHAVLRIQTSDGMLYLNNKYVSPSEEKAFFLEYEVGSVTMWPSHPSLNPPVIAEPPDSGEFPPFNIAKKSGENK